MTITLSQGPATALQLNTHGAKIELLRIDGHTILSQFKRGNGKDGITHPCSPNFGPEIVTDYDLDPHGPVRNSEWSVTGQSDSNVSLRCPISQGTYPEGVSIEQRFKMQDDSFILETEHLNKGTMPAPINFAQHFYWNTPEGWEDLRINDRLVKQEIRKNGLIALRKTNRISIPGLPEIILTQSGLPVAVLWAYESESNHFDTHYVCIEPAEGAIRSEFFGSLESQLRPGESRTVRLSISFKK